ncbi:hypothetical protein Bca4012_011547 [Brassica carinata]
MPPKKKKKIIRSLNGSSKLARYQSSLKSPASVKSLKQSSSLASASSADAVITTNVAEMADSKAMELVVRSSSASSADLAAVSPLSPVSETPLGVNTATTTVAETVSTPTVDVEVSTGVPVIRSPTSPSTQDALLDESVGVKNYTSLLKESATLEELGTPTEHVSGAPFVFIPDDNIAAAKEEFSDFIFARFHGDCPPIGRIIGVVNAIWTKTGPRIFVHHVGPGEYLLKITNVKTREALLGKTCWNISGYPMFVAPWSPEFNPEDVPLTNAVVPVELREVPYLLFINESLSRLATAVGKPVSLAPETERKENFQVAKLYVRVDLTKKLPSNIISGFSNGREVDISVSYPWMPMKCDSCGKYGHLRAKCKVLTPGQERERKRSVSPVGQRPKPRQKSRRGRRRSVTLVPHSVKEDVVADDPAELSTLEEGEIDPGIPAASSVGRLSVECVAGEAPNQLGTKSVGDTVESVVVRSDDVSTAKERSGASGTMVLQGKSDFAGSTGAVTYGTTDSSTSADAEDPYFLVQCRRCGWKVTKSY